MRYVALLRAVNVGGQKAVAMVDLRKLCEKLGYTGVQTILQSGNLVLETRLSGERLESALERETERTLLLRTEYFVRNEPEWAATVAENPFPKEAARDPGHLLLVALKRAPKAAAVDALRKTIVGREVVEAIGNRLYAVYPDGIGHSKLTLKLIEKHLETRGTGRNWNTVLKLLQLLREPFD